MAKRKTSTVRSGKSTALVHNPTERVGPHFYTLDVWLAQGPVGEEFARKNPTVLRTIQIRGDQTLADLHEVIFAAFDRFEEHMFEFQIPKNARDRNPARYSLQLAADFGDDTSSAGLVDETTIDSLCLKKKQKFMYWFDFGDDWWHGIQVVNIEPTVPAGKYPKITKRVGKSPPQYMDAQNEDGEEGDEDE